MVRPRSLKTNKTPDELPQYFRVNETDIRLVCSSFIASYILVLEMSTLARVCQLFFLIQICSFANEVVQDARHLDWYAMQYHLD